MLKIVKYQLLRVGQSFLDELEEVDWGDGQPDPRQVPVQAPQTGRISPDNPPPGVINEGNFEAYEPSQAEEQDDRQNYRDEIPTQNVLLGIPPDTQEIPYDGQEGQTAGDLLDHAMEANEVVSFEYTNRFGQYAGTRTVEPHYTFMARTTGNEVLVGFDRDQNDIRAFIVGNIHPNGVRYKGVNFDPRSEIMRGVY